MKLLNGIVSLYGVTFGKNLGSENFCDTNELPIPDHAEKWDCPGATDNFVPAGEKCELKCLAGYDPIKC